MVRVERSITLLARTILPEKLPAQGVDVDVDGLARADLGGFLAFGNGKT